MMQLDEASLISIFVDVRKEFLSLAYEQSSILRGMYYLCKSLQQIDQLGARRFLTRPIFRAPMAGTPPGVHWLWTIRTGGIVRL